MKVAVGSTNPVKLQGVKQAFNSYFPDKTIEYLPKTIASGVSDQPMSIKETATGAVNRAQATAGTDCDFSVGIEGGTEAFEINGKVSQIEIAWVCVVNCKTGKYEVATSPGFVVLPNLARHLHTGKNLTDAMEIEYGLKDMGAKNGYVGWLTDDKIDRQHITFEAVLLALSALLKERK